MTKLPKQWRYWCMLYGFRAHLDFKYSSWARSKWSWLYLTGQRKVWRVNCYGEFECGGPVETFDRWALCKTVSIPSIPKTEREFADAITQLTIKWNAKYELNESTR